jgi:type IV secretory pathway VirJ component
MEAGIFKYKVSFHFDTMVYLCSGICFNFKEVGIEPARWKSFFSLLVFCFCCPILSGRTVVIENNPVRPFTYYPEQYRDALYIITKCNPGSDKHITAIFFSGDGGWYGFEQSIADRLAVLGISTIGIDTKKYFWTRRNPESTASYVAELLARHGGELNGSRFMLIGYSLGAEYIPFVLNRLPESIRQKVLSTVMLSPTAVTDFEVHVSNMLGYGSKENKYDVIGEIRKVKDTRQILILGSDEKTNVPELLKGTSVEIAKIPGDHHYKRNSALIVQTMKEKSAF